MGRGDRSPGALRGLLDLPWWYALVALIAAHALAFAIVFPIDRLNGITVAAATLILQACSIVVVVLLVRRRSGLSRERLGLRRMTITPGRAALWIVGSLFASGLLIGIYYSASPPHGHFALLAHRPHGALAATCLAVGAVVGAPISEELLYRGVFYRALRSRLPVWPAVLLSSAVFGLMHWVGGDPLNSAAPRAIIGVFLCLLFERTGSLYPGMAMHAVLNSSVLAYVAPSIWWISGVAQLGALVVAIAVSVRDPRRKDAAWRTAAPAWESRQTRPPHPMNPPRAV